MGLEFHEGQGFKGDKGAQDGMATVDINVPTSSGIDQGIDGGAAVINGQQVFPIRVRLALDGQQIEFHLFFPGGG